MVGKPPGRRRSEPRDPVSGRCRPFGAHFSTHTLFQPRAPSMLPDDSPSRTMLVVAGALNLDLEFRLTSTVVLGASNPATLAESPGGVAANVARAAARELAVDSAGLHPDSAGVMLVTALGSDSASLRSHPALAGIELEGLERPASLHGRYVAVLDTDGELVIGLAATGIVETIVAAEIEAVLARIGFGAGALVLDTNLSSACLAGLVAPEQTVWSPSNPAAFVAMAVSPEKALRLRGLESSIDLLFCNRREAAALVERASDDRLDSLADGLTRLGFTSFVLSDGPGPLLVRTPGAEHLLSPVPASRAASGSVNGAGDALAGATLVHWLAGAELADAVRQAGLPAALAHIHRGSPDP